MSLYATAIRVGIEPLRSLAFGSISGTYAGIGTAFTHPIRIMKIYNGTDVDITLSDDGITDKEILPASGFVLLDFTSNAANASGWFFAEGDRIYAKGSPSSGSIYVSSYYGRGV
jgi:hypothetical protein